MRKINTQITTDPNVQGSNIYSVNTDQTENGFGTQPSILKGTPLQASADYPSTLTQALKRAADSNKSIIFVNDRNEEKELPYSDLLQQATHALAALQALGAKPGQAVILQLDELEEFLASFWACVLGKLIPVPVLPFRVANAGDSSFRKLQKISAQLGQAHILMSDKNAIAVNKASDESEHGELLPNCHIATFSDINNSDKKGIIFDSKPDDLAFLQFTSGSTSFPKGVELTHANVIATIQGMSASLGVTAESRLLNWMPFYHDMGIIAGHLMAVVGKCEVVAMKPFTFVRRPLLWLTKIHQHRITITFTPNFGFKRILEKVRPEHLEPLDLSCLEVILNGAEPISVRTSNQFLDLLNEHSGLPKECLLAGYGLAEASLAVTIAPRGELLKQHSLNRDALGCGDQIEYIAADDARATLFADEGPVVDGMDLRIVDDNDQVVPIGTVGHVQITGCSLTRGYYANDEANRQSFCGDWFRTGDLGFVNDDRFIITGRIKDIVFVNGQNYYSHDFEHTCEDIEGLERLVVIGHYNDENNEDEILAFVASGKQYTGAREKTAILRKVQMRINQCFDVTPTLFVLLKSAGEIPKTTSGKIIRHKLLENYIKGDFTNQCVNLIELLEIAPDLNSDSDSGKHVTIAEMKLLIRHWWSEVLGISQKAIGDHDPFFSLGGTSLKAIEVLTLAEESVECIITHEMFKQYDTIHKLATHIAHENINVRCKLHDVVQVNPGNAKAVANLTDAEESAVQLKRNANEIRDEDIAIIGMGCLFPQADNIEEFWNLLMEGRDCITEFPTDRGNIHQYFDKENTDISQTVCKWGSFIENHHFDPKFFNLSENEAIEMDPHQRVFLNAAWQAIQDAGLSSIEGSNIGVFVGASGTGFYQEQRDNTSLTPATLTGMLANLAAARVSHVYNLKGPSLSVDTACSSSLVSVDLACKSILSGESDIAIAGGVQIMETPIIYLLFSNAGILSPEGRCFAFSDKANGFVPGEGAGAVVLKRYQQAVDDGDRIYAVIKASAMNNDGASLGIMAPNPEGQENVIKEALAKANVNPADIGYVEAHGTGTNIGDLIEVRSLSLAFNEKQPAPKQACAIGSVKTNLGHQLAAAGISGLIKATLAVHHKRIPATLHCDNERKELKIEETPFFIAHKSVPWPKSGPNRLAAVNSFGFGGTNAHVILSSPYHEEDHHQLPALKDEPYVVCLSAKSADSLSASRDAFKQFVQNCPTETRMRDIAYTYAARRDHYRQNRIAIVAKTAEEAATLASGGRVDQATLIEKTSMPQMRRRIAWLFSGQGSQHPAMGRHLFGSEPVFRDIVNQCDEIAKPLLGASLRELLIASTSQQEVSSTAITQPIVFTMDYALAKLWQSWGVKPDFMLGHSVGEYVAACLAGVFSLEDALKIVIKRGALMGSLPTGGGMTAVLLEADKVSEQINTLGLPLEISALNGPTSTVVSGELNTLEKLHARLDKLNLTYAPLQVSHAFHSKLMAPVLDEFKQYLSGFRINPPSIPLISNVTGKLYQGDENKPDYWVNHIRQPVQFHKGIQCLTTAGTGVFLEIGAQAHLTGLTRRIANAETLILSSLPKYTPDAHEAQHLATTLAGLYANGIDIDWQHYYASHGERRLQLQSKTSDAEQRNPLKAGVSGGRMISVPTYPLERRSMFRLVGNQLYPFRHLFRRIGDDQYEFVPDPDAVIFRDHVVHKMPMLSGAGQCDLICHLHTTSFDHPPKCLRNLSFHQPWLSNSKLTATFDGKLEKSFSVTDAKGRVVFKGHSTSQTASEVPVKVQIKDVEQRLPHSYSGETVYQLFNDCGIEYGPFHSKIISMRASENEVLAHLRPPETNPAHWTRGYYLHPGILDSAFQATLGLLLAKMERKDADQTIPVMVPIGIESICIYKFLQGGEYISHVTLDNESGSDVSNDIISCNITICNAEGIPCVGIRKLQVRRMPASKKQPQRSKLHTVNEADHHNQTAEFFNLAWQENPVSETSLQPSRWLVLGSPTAVEQRIATELADTGVDTLLVPFNHYKDASQEDLQNIFASAESVDGILFCGDYEQPITCDDAADTHTMGILYRIFRAIISHTRKHKDYKKIRFIRMTRNACQIEGHEGEFDIRKSVSTGFLRSVRIEFPLLDIRQVDLGNTHDDYVAASIRNELIAKGGDTGEKPEVLYRDGKRFSLEAESVKLTVDHDREATFNSEKTFWIIGATSGVGQVLARYLASRYKAGLVLSGSRELPDPAEYDKYANTHSDSITETIKSIREIEALGSRVTYIRTDVRDADSIRASLETISKTQPALNGVYFSALQLDDKMILQKDWAGYRNMMEMRVNGVHELVRQVTPFQPEFFVLFSSMSGLTGNIGQSDYGASCAYMDAIPFVQPVNSACRFISIQWGAWELGQQVSDIVMESMQRNGFLHITGQLGMEALEKLILSNKKSIAFVPGSMDARHIASNINSLRQGLNANMNSLQQDKKPKPERSHAVKPAQEEITMSSVMKETPTTVTSSGNIQLLTSEFEKQRAMLMQLFESQNALLSGAMGNVSLQIPAVEMVQAVQLETPVEVYQPVIQEVTPTPSMAPDPAPPVITPEPEQAPPAAVESPAPSTDTDKPVDLYDYVRSMMAKAVEMHETDIDPDQNFMELGADSMTAMSMVKDMETRYDIELPATLLFEYTTLNELVEFLQNEIGDTSVSNG